MDKAVALSFCSHSFSLLFTFERVDNLLVTFVTSLLLLIIIIDLCYCTCTINSCKVSQLDQIKTHLLQQLRVIACGDCRQLGRFSHHRAHMNNNIPPTLTLLHDLIQSHLELLQQQRSSSLQPHITHLLQSQFQSRSPHPNPSLTPN